MSVLDVPGVLGRITSFFGMRHISISSIHQPEARMNQPVPVVLVTHKTPDRIVTEALRDLANAKLLLKPPTRIRIEE
jgi:homoserine dehydrogenase